MTLLSPRPLLRRWESSVSLRLRGEENLLRLQDLGGLWLWDIAAHEVTVRGVFGRQLNLKDLRLNLAPH